MKILVVGFDSAAPELLLGDERLVNMRRLMDAGCYGRLEGFGTPDFVPGWIGTEPLSDELARRGKRCVLLGKHALHHESDEPPAGPTHRLVEEILARSQAEFAAARQLLESSDWDYFQLVATGLDRLQRALGKAPGPARGLSSPACPARSIIGEYYRHLDEQLGGLLETLTAETVVLIVSTLGPRSLDDRMRESGGDIKLDDSTGASNGVFILAGSSCPDHGLMGGACLSDVAPTLLELGGYELPTSMPGRSLIARKAMPGLIQSNHCLNEEEIIRARLSGLGYIA